MSIGKEFSNLELDVNILKLPSQNHQRRAYIRKHILYVELIKYFMETLRYSVYYLCKEIFYKKGYDADVSTIIDFCKKNDIRTCTIKERANSKFVRDQYKATCLKKYGAENALSKNTESYKKRNETVERKYGVKNVFQIPFVINKSKNTMLEKYGVEHTVFLPTYERNYGRRSKIQIQIEDILSEHNINFEAEAQNRFKKYNIGLEKVYSPIVDILIEDKKIVLEIYGDKWHANPKIYKGTDKIEIWGGTVNATEIWKHDRLRKKQIEEFGYSVIELWECDIRKNINHINKILNERIFKS